MKPYVLLFILFSLNILGQQDSAILFYNKGVNAIKEGKYESDELVQKATALKDELPLLYQKSGLMDAPDVGMIDELLIKMREQYYGE